MKTPFYVFVLAGLLLVGCGNNNQSKAQSNNQSKTAQGTNAPAGGNNPLETGGGYVGALGRAQNRAVGTIDTASLDQAIQLFNVQEGRFPKDLNELVEKQFIGQIPPAPYGMKLEYDAGAGKVSVVRQ